MSYATQSLLSQDADMWNRVAACAATQQIEDAFHWANQNMWALAATPGWDEAYAYAINTNIERPGWADTTITDIMILSGVQARISYLQSLVPGP